MSRIKCFFVEDTGKRDVWDALNEAGEKIGENSRPIFRRTDTGEEIYHLSELPPGAMWFADWFENLWNPQLQYSLMVKTPGGDWHVDQQCSNCTMPSDRMQKEHHCWIIEGNLPDIESISVTKNGKTCGAGAGSILIGNYHGFLRNGYLEEC